MSTDFNTRAAELVQGDERDWHNYIVSLPVVDTYRLHDEIVAMMNDERTRDWGHWRQAAGSRLGAIVLINQRRWSMLWYHPSNRDIGDCLTTVYMTHKHWGRC